MTDPDDTVVLRHGDAATVRMPRVGTDERVTRKTSDTGDETAIITPMVPSSRPEQLNYLGAVVELYELIGKIITDCSGNGRWTSARSFRVEATWTGTILTLKSRRRLATLTIVVASNDAVALSVARQLALPGGEFSWREDRPGNQHIGVWNAFPASTK